MPSVNFYLDKSKPNRFGETLLYLYFRVKKETLKIPIGERIHPKHWDETKQKVRKTYQGYSVFNFQLEKLVAEVNEAFRLAKLSGNQFSLDDIKKSLLTKSTLIEKETFKDIFQKWIDSKKLTAKALSIKNYKVLLTSLTEFEKNNYLKLDISKFDKNFLTLYLNYLIEFNKLSDNTIATRFKTLKTFLHWATENEYPTNQAFRSFKSVSFKTPDTIALSQTELLELSKFNSIPERLIQVRDVFLFGCYTGLRYSDIQALRPESIVKSGTGQYMVSITVIKTRKKLDIPLNTEAMKLIKKYEGSFNHCLPVISNQKSNLYLKELFQLYGMTAKKTLVTFSGSTRKETDYHKYELITTHTARRTFATLSIEKGMRIDMLSKFLGHASVKQTMEYVKTTDSEKIKEMLKVWE